MLTKPNFRMFTVGSSVFIELDGKSLGDGVKSAELITTYPCKGNQRETILMLGIDISQFRFMPDGFFDKAYERASNFKPPIETHNERLK